MSLVFFTGRAPKNLGFAVNKKSSVLSKRKFCNGDSLLPVCSVPKQTKLQHYSKFIKDQLDHYYSGTKNMYTQTKEATSIVLSKPPNARTNFEKLFIQDAGRDVGRLLPFGVCVVVPGGEVFIPVLVVKGFMPSTYIMETPIETKVSYAKQFQQTLTRYKSSEFDVEHILKQLQPGKRLELQEYQAIATSLAKHITSDEHLAIDQLRTLCQFFGIPTDKLLSNFRAVSSLRSYFGTTGERQPEELRQDLKTKMQTICEYDKAIEADGGFDTLPEAKISALSRIRGIYHTDLGETKHLLRIWLALSQQARLPLHMLALCSTFFATQSFVTAQILKPQ